MVQTNVLDAKIKAVRKAMYEFIKYNDDADMLTDFMIEAIIDKTMLNLGYNLQQGYESLNEN